MTPAQPPPPQEASLVRLAREAAGLSPESAAARMAIRFSGSRWRQIEAGWRKDTDTPVIAKPGTLAHMARAVSLASARLTEAGREDAAVVARELEHAALTPEPASAAPRDPLLDLEDWQRRVILNALDDRPRSKREKARLLRTLAAKIDAQADAESQPDHEKQR